MGKEKKIFTVQIRISPTEKEMLKTIKEHHSNMTASMLFRKCIHDNYNELNLNEGISNFEIG